MKTTATSLAAAFFAVAFSVSSAKGETIAPGATYSQNFDSIGNSATAALPSGWKVAASSSARAVTATEWEAAGTQTVKAGTGESSTGGIYNFWNAADPSDHGVGFLATGSATKTGNLYLSLTAANDIPSFVVSYDVKCYRNNSRQFQFQLYYSTDAGVTWMSAGTSFLTKPSPLSQTVSGKDGLVSPAGVTSISSETIDVPLAAGDTIILCWSYSVPSNTTTSNAQGLGIDNVVIVASSYPNRTPVSLQASESVTATVGVAASLDLSNYFSDADGDTLTYAVESGVGTVSGSTWTYTPAAAGAFSAVVSATDPDGASATMAIAVTVVETPILDSPTGLASSNRSYTSFDLSWNAVSGADGYVVTLSPADGSVAVSGTSATASGLSEGTTYTVNVVATGAGAIDSAPASVQVQTLVHVPLAVPAGLAVVSVSESGFTVSWDAVANAGSYSVSVLDDNDAAAGTVSVSGTSATVSGLSADTDYSVKVKALAPSGDTPYLDSGWSDSVTIATDLVGGLKRATLFDETFSKCTGNWGANAPGAFSYSYSDSNYVWSVTSAKRGYSGMRLGNKSTSDAAVTPTIHPVNDTACTVSLSFIAAGWNAGDRMAVSIPEASWTQEIILSNAVDTAASTPLPTGDGYSFGPYDIFVSGSFVVSFQCVSGDGRMGIDSVKVTQVYDPDYAVLATPTDVAASDIGKYGFTVSWTGVANAAGYEVWLNGSLAESCASTDSSVELTGLQDGTTYSVQVRALGDNLHCGDSPLTTAVSVETEEDVQSIVFTVTGAPAGDVYAGDPVSFTVVAAVESTGAAAQVNFSGIAGATFENGTFSWTPAEADVGTNVATFASGTYSTNVAISVVSAYKIETLATENFSKITSTSWTSTSGYATEMAGDIGTWTGVDIIKTKGAIIIGRRTSSGTIVSPAISLKVRTGGSLSVSFDTGSLPGTKASIQAQILDAADDKVLYTTNFATVAALPSNATAVSDAGVRFSVEPDDFVSLPSAVKIAFTTYASEGDDYQRAYVDSVVFSQPVSAKIRDLATPTGLALVGEAGENGFTVGWNAVDGATNYAVRVLDAAGTAVFSAPFCATTTVAATGFADDEVYTVQVRAAGDTALWFASDWSAPVAVRTARSALHPTLRLGAWSNVAGENHPVATLANTAAATAELDGGSAAILSLTGVSPSPVAAPVLSAGTLSWTPAEADADKTFTLAFSMQAAAENAIVYATNVAVAVTSLPDTQSPEVTVESVSWEQIVLSWTSQYRATNYAVRAWTGPEDPEADGTRYVENFLGYPAVKPDGWIFDNGDDFYNDWRRVAFKMDGDSLVSPLFDTPPATLTFGLYPHTAGNSVIRLFGSAGGMAQGDWELLATYSGADGTLKTVDDVPEIDLTGRELRRFMWTFERASGGVGIGGIVFTGSGLPTARFLTGWSSRSKLLGNVAGATVDKVRPGDYLDRSRDPGTGEWIERGTTRRNWAEVTVFGTDGLARSTVVPVAVPWTPYAKRATLIVVQ